MKNFINWGRKMRENLVDKVKKSFEENNIILSDDLKNWVIPGGVTNQFMTTSDFKNNKYLVRINGKLWPPFTREDESYNLEQLKKHKIPNNVLINSPSDGFQICQNHHEENRFDNIAPEKKTDLLRKISNSIRKYHEIDAFNNTYPVGNTINNSFNRLSKDQQEDLRDTYKIVMSMFSTLNADAKNKVSSHNDLLPTSIYDYKGTISIVDWEYSGKNHCCYDLALFSIKSSLTSTEEEVLLRHYNPDGDLNIEYGLNLMKPVVNFLLLLWDLPSNRGEAEDIATRLFFTIQSAISHQAAKSLTFEESLSFFRPNKKDMEPNKVSNNLPTLEPEEDNVSGKTINNPNHF